MKSIIDLDRYPIRDLTSEVASEFVDQCRQEYLKSGFCMLSGFILPDVLQLPAKEADQVSSRAYICGISHNAYLTDVPRGDENDVAKTQLQTYVGSVAHDYIDETALLRKLYRW